MKRFLLWLNSVRLRIYSLLLLDNNPPISAAAASHYPAVDTRSSVVFVVSSILLAVFYYYGRAGAFYSTGMPFVLWLSGLESLPYESLISFIYWAVASVFIRIVIPCFFILVVFRDSLRDYGYRLPEKGHWIIYAILFLIMLPVIYIASLSPAFHTKYPFYQEAGESWTQFLIYEACYAVQFFAVEAFFRGFLLFGLFKKLGYHAIFIMTIPYCMIHFGKPPAEVFGSIIAGLALGFLALESRSWLPGAFLHTAVGLTMDSLALSS